MTRQPEKDTAIYTRLSRDDELQGDSNSIIHQAESESLSQNVGIGMKRAIKEGTVSFQYKKLLGYRRGENGGPEIVPEEAETVRLIYRLFLDGWSLGDIQKELTEKGLPTAEGIQGW